MPITPTAEQADAVQRFHSGQALKITAFAGTGKTTTLSQIAEATPRRGLYLAFNRAIRLAAAARFPIQRVECLTTHSLALRAIRASHHRLTNDRLTTSLWPNVLVTSLSLVRKQYDSGLVITPIQQAHMILGTVTAFCHSADDSISHKHVPLIGRLHAIPKPAQEEIRDWACVAANGLWKQMTDPAGSMPLGHDGYLKLWSLSRPSISADYILLDEAQDTNPAVLSVLSAQRSQVVYVGDAHQQIYEWRGAVNAMNDMQAHEHAYLTQSFRFGPRLADAATNVLRSLGEKRRLQGNPAQQTDITAAGPVDAVLARTNATAIVEALEALDSGLTPFVVGGTKDLRELVSDVYQLKNGNPGTRPEFFGFKNWQEVVDFARTEEGASLLTFVQIVEQHGEKRLWFVISQIETEEADASLVISTAHKAKGREWDRVRLTNDFASKRLAADAPAPEAEVRLFYVAMTRAKKQLVIDPGILEEFETASWRDKRVTKAASPALSAKHNQDQSPLVTAERSHTSPVAVENLGVIERMRARLREG
jgi:superfamily I DNA/RNA helicase